MTHTFEAPIAAAPHLLKVLQEGPNVYCALVTDKACMAQSL